MANPIPTECPHNTVTKISTATLKTGLTIMEGGKKYYRTWVLTGEPAPDPPVNLNNPRVPASSPWLEIPVYNSKFIPTAASDLYVYATGGDPKVSGFIEVAI